ncbi:ATP-binding protein [Amycolatopsis benzoatilytica]|uniref:ATP-binding protein n=1 Tax=Amycolatopsis benzoatilytica TaxID=346045 RepID=UPI0004845F37|nr:ATP-binding protein [Amycolatopsis benzoatilytica]
MLDDELAEIVGNLRRLGGDDADVEAKRAEDRLPKSVRDTVSAFANTHGGVLVLGLDEASGFEATGVRDPAKMTADLASLCAEEMEPPLRPLIRVHRFEGVDLVVAEVPVLDSRSRPCFAKRLGMAQGSFVRVGDGDRRLSAYEVHLMTAGRGQPRDDEEPVPGAGIDELDPDLVSTFVARLRQQRPYAFADLSRLDVLRRIKVLAGDQATVAGLLALGRYPQHFFPQLMVSFVHYPTTEGADVRTGTRFLDNKVLEGSIPVMVRDVLAVLRANMARRATVRGAGRIDSWEYPETALREAVVNALVHRDYSPESRGAQVQLEMYPDRLVVRNPGGLYGPVTEETLGEEGVSSARNATLLKLLEDVPLPGTARTVCENRGSGIRTMMTALRDASLSPPRFVDKISLFRVEFPNHALISDEIVAWIRGLGEYGLTDSQCLGLAMSKAGDVLDNQSYRGATGVDSRRATAELGDLVARGLLWQTGGRRWARYELADSARAARPTGRRDRRREVLEALGDAELTRAELADLLGMPDKTVSRWLRVLRDEGLVELIGESPRSPRARYRRTSKVMLGE